MKTLKIVIGIVAVVTALTMMPKGKMSGHQPRLYHDIEASQQLQMSLDSMEFANKMSVWSK